MRDVGDMGREAWTAYHSDDALHKPSPEIAASLGISGLSRRVRRNPNACRTICNLHESLWDSTAPLTSCFAIRLGAVLRWRSVYIERSHEGGNRAALVDQHVCDFEMRRLMG